MKRQTTGRLSPRPRPRNLFGIAGAVGGWTGRACPVHRPGTAWWVSGVNQDSHYLLCEGCGSAACLHHFAMPVQVRMLIPQQYDTAILRARFSRQTLHPSALHCPPSAATVRRMSACKAECGPRLWSRLRGLGATTLASSSKRSPLHSMVHDRFVEVFGKPESSLGRDDHWGLKPEGPTAPASMYW